MTQRYETADLRQNIQRAIALELDEQGKPTLKVQPEQLELEIFTRIAGDDTEPALLGRFPVSKIRIGED